MRRGRMSDVAVVHRPPAIGMDFSMKGQLCMCFFFFNVSEQDLCGCASKSTEQDR